MIPRADRTLRGRWAEEVAARHLAEHGLVCRDRNFRSRHGEIDLVMEDGGVLVFVEVRSRGGTGFMDPAESVDVPKRRRIVRTAEAWLRTRRRSPLPACRFDVVAVTGGRMRPTSGGFGVPSTRDPCDHGTSRPNPRVPQMSRPALTLASVLASVLVLGGCGAPIVVGTAGVAGSGAVAVDKRTFGTMVEDEGIEWKVRAALNQAGLKEDERHNVKVTSFNRIVLLTGQVPDEEAKGKAADEAGRVEQVRGVHNELVLGPPTKLSTRSADAVVTGRVKVAVAANSDLKPPANVNNKVVTEDGVVFLMGLVTRGEAEAITAAAQSVPGVRQIVRLFEYPDS